jgi:hypothetical protein
MAVIPAKAGMTAVWIACEAAQNTCRTAVGFRRNDAEAMERKK